MSTMQAKFTTTATSIMTTANSARLIVLLPSGTGHLASFVIVIWDET